MSDPQPIEVEPEVFACTSCNSTAHWLDQPDGTWLCTSCNTYHAWPDGFEGA